MGGRENTEKTFSVGFFIRKKNYRTKSRVQRETPWGGIGIPAEEEVTKGQKLAHMPKQKSKDGHLPTRLTGVLNL